MSRRFCCCIIEWTRSWVLFHQACLMEAIRIYGNEECSSNKGWTNLNESCTSWSSQSTPPGGGLQHFHICSRLLAHQSMNPDEDARAYHPIIEHTLYDVITSGRRSCPLMQKLDAYSNECIPTDDCLTVHSIVSSDKWLITQWEQLEQREQAVFTLVCTGRRC